MNRIVRLKNLGIACVCSLLPIQLFSQSIFIPPYKNTWTKPPREIPSRTSTDAPLMGNGDLLATLGYQTGKLRYYISKTDFGRWVSRYGHGEQEFNTAGSRLVAHLDINFHSAEEKESTPFSASQEIWNGQTVVKIGDNISVTSWVCATQNLIFIKVNALERNAKVSVSLGAPENKMAKLSAGQLKNVTWQTRFFEEEVDIPAAAAIAVKTINYDTPAEMLVEKGRPLLLAIAVESNFSQKNTLEYVCNSLSGINAHNVPRFLELHNAWWKQYWQKSSVWLNDSLMMKSYYQGLYTMGACSRNVNFPPGIFGWISDDTPAWNNDYHLNYNFEAPFYALYTANRLEQALPYDAPILAFMPRGKWYAEQVTHTRGILYPVGIGPMGTEVTRQVDTFYSHLHPTGIEKGGMFWQQRSNAAYALLNMGQYWYSTYDTAYAKKIYPYAKAVAEFWEDYLRSEEGRYVIYNDAIHEGSGNDINPILSLGLVRYVFNLMIDLSNDMHIQETDAGKWKNILSHISPFPTQTRNGRVVFRYTEKGLDWYPGNGLGAQHIYPANAITLDSDTALLSVSRNTIEEMSRWKDYNTSSSFFMAAIRVGYNADTIYNKLHAFIANTRPNGFINNNVHGIENACVVANAIDEMLCMSVGNVIRLFPVLPTGIDASFSKLRANGAFLVSAKIKSGNISDVEFMSEKGRSLTFDNPWKKGKIRVIRAGKPAEQLTGARFTVSTEKGERIRIVRE
ncbi:MAG: hypothetical protein J7623_08405 [Chitinophaga sp.]|uniref:glycosyl hydrolase family 95 catalytic domain-containing protein n=1 Tax=Chitinophaga sp. TaxID=1869181 RepID=UPI001B2D3966|nr:hypothetical protein [Chitinophaga sp.]MBO9728643.1 hypothetical protein [Chitinophaga sp.]